MSHFTCRIISVTGLRVCLNVFHSVIKRNFYCVSAIVLMRKGLFWVSRFLVGIGIQFSNTE